MTLYEFNALDEMEQAEAVWDGVRINERHDEIHDILLYQIDAFYVEIYYNREHNEIVRFRAFADPDQSFGYLGKINIYGLINRK